MMLYGDWMFRQVAKDAADVEDALQDLILLTRVDSLEALEALDREPTRAELDALHELDPINEADEAYCQSSYEDPNER